MTYMKAVKIGRSLTNRIWLKPIQNWGFLTQWS